MNQKPLTICSFIVPSQRRFGKRLKSHKDINKYGMELLWRIASRIGSEKNTYPCLGWLRFVGTYGSKGIEPSSRGAHL